MMGCESAPTSAGDCVTVRNAPLSHNHTGDLEKRELLSYFVCVCMGQTNHRGRRKIKRNP